MSLDTGLRITERVLAIRDDVKTLLGERYNDRIAEYREIVRTAAGHFGCDPIEVPLRIAQDARAGGRELGEVSVALLVAASVEEVEATPVAK